MYLRTLTVENLRNLRLAELDLRSNGRPQRWTLLVGDNGSGKSSLLQAIGLAACEPELLPALLGDSHAWIRSGARRASIVAEFESDTGERTVRRLELRRGDPHDDLIRRPQRPGRASRTRRPSLPFVAAYGSTRRTSTRRPRALAGVPSASRLASLYLHEWRLRPLTTWIRRVLRSRRADGLQRVGRIVEQLLPGVSVQGLEPGSNEPLLKTPNGVLPLRQLSEGFQNLSTWCGDLLVELADAFGAEADPANVKGVVLVDEIELHLHLNWQRDLRAFLGALFPGLQFVVTSHSALIVQQAAKDEVFFIGAEHGAPVVQRYRASPRRLLVHQLLATPMFGSQPLDSLQVQMRKEEYRLLRELERGEAEERRFRELRDELMGMPEFTVLGEAEQRRMELIERVAKRLEAHPAQ